MCTVEGEGSIYGRGVVGYTTEQVLEKREAEIDVSSRVVEMVWKSVGRVAAASEKKSERGDHEEGSLVIYVSIAGYKTTKHESSATRDRRVRP